MAKNTKPGAGGAGLGRVSILGRMPDEYNTANLALKRIYARVAVSEHVALVMASHAGFRMEAHDAR